MTRYPYFSCLSLQLHSVDKYSTCVFNKFAYLLSHFCCLFLFRFWHCQFPTSTSYYPRLINIGMAEEFAKCMFLLLERLEVFQLSALTSPNLFNVLVNHNLFGQPTYGYRYWEEYSGVFICNLSENVSYCYKAGVSKCTLQYR